MKHFSDLVAKIKSLSKATLIMLGIGVTSFTLAITSLAVGLGIQFSKASTPIVTNNTVLLTTGPTPSVNYETHRQLWDLVTAAGKTNKTTNSTGTHLSSDANQIKTANAGALPEVKIFEPITTGSNQTVKDFTAQPWRLAYITYDGADAILTFFMVAPYTTSAWGNNGSNYQNSTIRQTLFAAYNAVSPNYNTSIIALPSSLPGNWQSTTSYVGDRLNATTLQDPVWIPGQSEFGRTRDGYPDQGHASFFGFSTAAGRTETNWNGSGARWMRSDIAADQGWIIGNPYDTKSQWHVYRNVGLGVSPGVHIRLSAPAAPVEPDDGGDDNGGDDGDGSDNGDDNGGDDNGGEVPTPTPFTPTDDQSQRGLSAGAIGGIIAAVLITLGASACLTIYLISRRRKSTL